MQLTGYEKDLEGLLENGRIGYWYLCIGDTTLLDTFLTAYDAARNYNINKGQNAECF